jgi:hypothetical protein
VLPVLLAETLTELGVGEPFKTTVAVVVLVSVVVEVSAVLLEPPLTSTTEYSPDLRCSRRSRGRSRGMADVDSNSTVETAMISLDDFMRILK